MEVESAWLLEFLVILKELQFLTELLNLLNLVTESHGISAAYLQQYFLMYTFHTLQYVAGALCMYGTCIIC